MGRASAGTTHGLQCPDCATELELAPDGSNGVLRLYCPGCGGRFRAAAPDRSQWTGPARGPPLPDRLSVHSQLRWRAMVLRILEHLYWSVTRRLC